MIIQKSINVPEGNVFTHNPDGTVSTIIMFSDSFVDNEGDVVEQNWTKSSKVALLAHHDRGTDPIGRIDELWTEGTQSFAKITFHSPDKDERGAKYAYFAEFGSMPGVSAGFSAKSVSIAKDRLDKFECPLHIKSPKLFEISFVTTPANDRAGVVEKNMSIKKSLLKQSTPREVTMDDNIKTPIEVEKSAEPQVLKAEAVKAFEVEKESSADILKKEIEGLAAAVADMKAEAVNTATQIRKSIEQAFEKLASEFASNASSEVKIEKSEKPKESAIELTDAEFAKLVKKASLNKLKSAE